MLLNHTCALLGAVGDAPPDHCEFDHRSPAGAIVETTRPSQAALRIAAALSCIHPRITPSSASACERVGSRSRPASDQDIDLIARAIVESLQQSNWVFEL